MITYPVRTCEHGYNSVRAECASVRGRVIASENHRARRTQRGNSISPGVGCAAYGFGAERADRGTRADLKTKFRTVFVRADEKKIVPDIFRTCARPINIFRNGFDVKRTTKRYLFIFDQIYEYTYTSKIPSDKNYEKALSSHVINDFVELTF